MRYVKGSGQSYHQGAYWPVAMMVLLVAQGLQDSVRLAAVACDSTHA